MVFLECNQITYKHGYQVHQYFLWRIQRQASFPFVLINKGNIILVTNNEFVTKINTF